MIIDDQWPAAAASSSVVEILSLKFDDSANSQRTILRFAQLDLLLLKANCFHTSVSNQGFQKHVRVCLLPCRLEQIVC